MSIAAPQARAEEVAEKLVRVRGFLDETGLEAALFTRQFLVGWITAGMEDRVIRSDDSTFVWALVTRDAAYILTSNIEAERLAAEEDPTALGFELRSRPWYEGAFGALVDEIVDPARIANDGVGPGRAMPLELQQLRMALTAGERERMRVLGRESCDALESALRDLRPGATEAQLAAEVIGRLEAASVFGFGLLIGADDRRRRFRHPTISRAPIERDVLVVMVAVRGGLNVAASRTASIGPVDPLLSERHLVACEAEARAIEACRPGTTYGEALDALISTYARHGYADEWREHTQGGPIGYGGREFVPPPLSHADRFSNFEVALHHAVAWNPTVQGAKSEDTFLVGEEGNELITNSSNWPTATVETANGSAQRPAILEL